MPTPSLTSQTKKPSSIVYSNYSTNPFSADFQTNYCDNDPNTRGGIGINNLNNTSTFKAAGYGFTLPTTAVIKGIYFAQKVGAKPFFSSGESSPAEFIKNIGSENTDSNVYGNQKTTGTVHNLPYSEWSDNYGFGGSDDLWGNALGALTAAKINSANWGIYETHKHWAGNYSYPHAAYYYDANLTVYYYDPALADITDAVLTSATKTTLNVQANITATGFMGTDYGVTQRGFCYKLASEIGDPTTADSKVFDNGTFQTGSFSKTISGLTQGKKYKVRSYATNSKGTSYGATTEVYALGWEDPANAFSDDLLYTSIPSTDGVLSIALSKNAGSTFSAAKTIQLDGTEQEFTVGANDLWGSAWNGGDLSNANFKVQINRNDDPTGNDQIYGNFGFSIPPSYYVSGIEIKVKAKWDGTKILINQIRSRISYGNSPTPVIEGSVAYAANGRKPTEGAGAGTGVLVMWDSKAVPTWVVLGGNNDTVQS